VTIEPRADSIAPNATKTRMIAVSADLLNINTAAAMVFGITLLQCT
jgi:hypothetical protein